MAASLKPGPAPLLLDVSTVERTAVFMCVGRLLAENAHLLKAEVRQLIPTCDSVILDLSGLAAMDSSGLGAIVSLYVSAKTAHCDFKLINFNKRIRDLLGLSKVLYALETCGAYSLKMP